MMIIEITKQHLRQMNSVMIIEITKQHLRQMNSVMIIEIHKTAVKADKVSDDNQNSQNSS